MYTRKREKNRSWSKEEKYEIIRPFFEDYMSKRAIAKKHDISYSVIDKWITKYIEGGLDALESSESGSGRGNPYAALHTSKSLTEVERLKLENMKLKIENERLKKGYLVKGVGANKEFVTTSEKNMK